MSRPQYLLTCLICLPLLLASGGRDAHAQKHDRCENMTFSVFAAPSRMINTLGIYYRLLESYHYTGFGAQMGFLTRPQGENWFDKAYNYPEFGVGLWFQPYASGLDFKNDSHLGNILNLYGYGNWDLLKSSRFSFGPFAKIGFAFSGSKYDAVTNPSNLYIGTNLEYLVNVGLEGSARISDHMALTLAAMGLHHSNGKQGIPNFGLNECGIIAGAKYYIGSAVERKSSAEKPERPEITDKLMLSPYFASGVHSCERIWKARDKQGAAPLFQRLMAGADLSFRYHPIFASGVGIDMTYTTNIPELKTCDQAKYPEEYPSMRYCPFYCGVAAFQQFHYKQFEMHVKLGYYVFKETGKTEDWGRAYQKIGFRYNFLNNLYLGFDMLAVNYDSSDCLEFSIGYNIPLKRS